MPNDKCLKCVICNSNTHSFLNMGNQSFKYTKYDNELDYNPKHKNIEEKRSLHLYYCQHCYHIQLNSGLRLNYDYEYDYDEDYFREFAFYSLLRLNNIKEINTSQLKILDISCNNILQLDAFKKYNNEIITVGVGNIDNNEFTTSTVIKLKEKYGAFDIIISQHSFNNTLTPNDDLNLCKQLLNPNGIIFIFIQTLFKNINDFSPTISTNFFNSCSMNLLCDQNGLVLNNTIDAPTNNYLFEITNEYTEDSNFYQSILNEMYNNSYDETIFANYKLQFIKSKNYFENTLINHKLLGKNIIGIGNTLESNLYLNCIDNIKNYIDYIIDDKHANLHTPCSNIYISDETGFKDITKNTILLILDKNITTEMIDLQLLEYNIQFKVPYIHM